MYANLISLIVSCWNSAPMGQNFNWLRSSPKGVLTSMCECRLRSLHPRWGWSDYLYSVNPTPPVSDYVCYDGFDRSYCCRLFHTTSCPLGEKLLSTLGPLVRKSIFHQNAAYKGLFSPKEQSKRTISKNLDIVPNKINIVLLYCSARLWNAQVND